MKLKDLLPINFSMKTHAFALLILTLLSNCNAQTKSLSTTVLQLEDLDFSTPVSALLPADSKDTTYDAMYTVKNTSLQKFTIKANEYEEDAPPTWIEYRQFQSRSSDELAKFADFTFNTFNVVVSLEEDDMMLFNAIASDLSKKESDDFIHLLDKKYGTAVKTEGDFMEPFAVYTWTLKDRILKYVPLYDDEHNTLKIVIDKENNTLEEAEKTPHYQGLFYVIQAKYSEQLIGRFHTGELLYCQ